MQRKLSFIIPAYNEADSLPELYERVLENIHACQAESLASDYEFLFIDDGSTDTTVSVLRDLHAKDPNVRYILFRKNFGKSIAMQTALRNITGEVIITMDADLQDEPNELKNFLAKIDEGFDMVVGWKVNRLDPMEKKLPSRLFNRVTSIMSGLKLHDFDCGYKAFTRVVADSLDLYGEMHRFVPVLAYRNGFRITEIPVQHNKRKHGFSKYGLKRYMRGLFDFISVAYLSRYSDRPMYLFGKLGFLSLFCGGGICSYLAFEKAFGGSIGQRPLLTLGVLLLVMGCQFITIGLIGNLMVENAIRDRYSEAHVREKT